MRFLTTLFLALLSAGVIVGWQYRAAIGPKLGIVLPTTAAPSNPFAEITPNSLIRIEIEPDIRLERDGTAWNVAGGWPARQDEIEQLVAALAGLSSRFTPIDATDRQATAAPLIVRLTVRKPDAGEKTLRLTIEKSANKAGGNPFTEPTLVHVDDGREIYRLAPGLLAQLHKHREDFLRRRLFPDIVRAKFPAASSFGGDAELSPPAVAILDARSIQINGPDGPWTLRRRDDVPLFGNRQGNAPASVVPEKLATGWELQAPVVDRPDPERLRGVLAAVPEMWVEQFVSETDPAKTGLDHPERSLRVTTPQRELTVLIGKVSRVKEIKPPPPPPANPFSPPPPPAPPVREEYRYAKLPNHPQVFEVRADRFADLFVKPAELRDARIARFKTADVKQLDIALPDRKLSFVRQKDAATGEESWRVAVPVNAPAEAAKVNEVLDKLAEMKATGDDVIDSGDLKPFGLATDDTASTVTLRITEEEPGVTIDVAKTTTTRTIELRLGKHDAAKKKLFLQTSGVARVNAVGDDLMKLLERPVLTYRGRRVIDMSASQVGGLSIDRGTDPFTLTQADGKWSISWPGATAGIPADASKAVNLAGDLSRLEAMEFVNFTPSAEDLKNYGLDAPTLKATLSFTGKATPERVLFLGKTSEGKQPAVYAKLADSPEVFTLRPQLKEAVEQPSLAYRPLQLWQVSGPTITRIAVERSNEKYALHRDDALWKVSGPFEANAFLPAVQPILEAASTPRAERYEAHGDAELAKFGLDQPSLTLRVTRKTDAAPVENVLHLGKPAADAAQRYARLEGQPGVFVLPAPTVGAIDRPALELLDRRLLDLDPRAIVRFEGATGGKPWSAKREGEKWRVESAAGDRLVFDGLVAAWAGLRAQRFAAYGTSELSKFGLDSPTATITAFVQAGEKEVPHEIAVGHIVEGTANSRYARVDNGPAVAVLSGGVSAEFTRGGMDLVDRTMFNFEPRELVSVRRTVGEQEMMIERKDNVWQITKPTAAPGDEPALAEMADRLGGLRALRVASLGKNELKAFGLDAPAAAFELMLAEKDGKLRTLTLKIGGAAQPDGRFASVGGDTIFVLPDSPSDPLTSRLLAEPIKFRDRGIANFSEADRVTIVRSGRTTTFSKSDGRWKMTAPIEAEAESRELDDMVAAASKLRADEMLAEKPGDLKLFGLDKPAAELTFFVGDRETAKLLVSDRGGDGRSAIKTASGDLVGKLDAGSSNRMLAEYRKRSLWNNLDVAQVDMLIINSGASPLVLMKGDAGWHVSGKSDQPVRPDAIADLLVTLAGLKVERYAADEKPDPKLYGLDPAQHTIVVRTRSGQTTTLSLGRFEGDSKRPYAATPDRPGVVVVLSETDGARVFKPADEYVGK